MTVVAKVLVPAKIMSNAQTTQYTCGVLHTIIDKFTVTNYSAGAVTFSVNLVTSGDTPGNQNLIISNQTLSAGQCYTCPELVGHVLDTNGFISTVAGAASSLEMRVSGREVS
jgi:hypothetical protein